MTLWGLADADVLRVLELLAAGELPSVIKKRHMPHVDAFVLQRVMRNKDAPSVQSVVERYPEWRATHEQAQQATALELEKRGATAAAVQQVSEYEAKRLQRMRENQEKMVALGMHKLAPKREAVKRKADLAAIEAVRANPRRSARISSIPALHSSEQDNALMRAEQDELLARALVQRRHEWLRQRSRAAVLAYEELDLPVVDLSVAVAAATTGDTTPRPAPPVKRQRLSSMVLDIKLETFHARWLGKQIWPRGKATVMQGMCPRHTPLFSKMSGVQPWHNAVVLFVNVQGDSLYDNIFHQVGGGTSVSSPSTNSNNLSINDTVDTENSTSSDTTSDGAVYFQWFAQSRHHVASPAIVRLLNAQKGDASLRLEDATYYEPTPAPASPSANASATPAPAEPVLLFIRHVDGPYIYCGRLGYLGYRTDSSPLEFRWQLLDAAALEWHKIRTLVESSSVRVDDAAVTEA